MIVARQSTARTITVGPVLDASGAAVTDSVVGDFKIAKNGGAPAALNGSATLTHRHTGNYSLALTASDLDTVGQAEITCDDTVNACAIKDLTVIEEAVYDEMFAASALGYIANAPVNVAQLGGSAQSLTDLKDFADDGYDPSTNKVQGVALTDTVTTYTGNTPQTGDSYARIGANGASLTSLATAAELAKVPKSDSNVTWNATALGSVTTAATAATPTAAAVTGDVGGKVLGGGAGTITGTGVRAIDGSGNAIAPASATTALSNTLGVAGAGLTDLGGMSNTMKAQVNTEADTAASDYGALKPTTAGRTLDVTATGAAGVDWGNVENATTTVDLSGTTISTSQVVASVSGAVGSVTGAVGSVTGNVGGSVAGSVGSVTGDVGGNVTGSIGSLGAQAKADVNAEADTAASDYGALRPTTAGRTLDVTATGASGIDWGNVENPTTTLDLSSTTISTSQAVASVAGAVGSVSGAVGSVTGNVGGNVAGSVGSVTARVTANVDQLGASAQSLTDLKDFADTGYDPAAHKVAGVVLVDTTTTNTDMRGTDNAALAVTALSTATWTNLRAGYLDNLSAGAAALEATVQAILTDTGTDGVIIAQSTREAIADLTLSRSVSNVQDAAAPHSLCTIILGSLESSRVGTTWTIYKIDGTTSYLVKTLTVDAAADPITAVT